MKICREGAGNKPVEIRRSRLAFGAVTFLLLTVGIFWYQFSSIHAGTQAPRWDQLQWRYLLLILLCLPIETLASGLRIWVLCRVLSPGISVWTCVKAEWANVAVSMLTPSQTGGGPAQIYILSREGVRNGTALTISLLSFVGTMAGLLCMGLYSLLVSRVSDRGYLVVAAASSLTAISAAMLLAASSPALFRHALAKTSRIFWRMVGRQDHLVDWWPPGNARTGAPLDRMGTLSARLTNIIYAYREDMARFLRLGKTSFAWACLLSLVFLFSRCLMPYLCIRFLGIESSTLRQVIEIQAALIFLVFFAPTPGGAGFAEGASLSIMAGVVPIGFAPYYNLLWRFSTLYLTAMAGLFCLLRALMKDAGQVVRHTNHKHDPWRRKHS